MVGMIWLDILKHAPTILAAADALRTRVGANDAGDRTRSVERDQSALHQGFVRRACRN
jgi:hypothetical protein